MVVAADGFSGLEEVRLGRPSSHKLGRPPVHSPTVRQRSRACVRRRSFLRVETTRGTDGRVRHSSGNGPRVGREKSKHIDIESRTAKQRCISKATGVYGFIGNACAVFRSSTSDFRPINLENLNVVCYKCPSVRYCRHATDILYNLQVKDLSAQHFSDTL